MKLNKRASLTRKKYKNLMKLCSKNGNYFTYAEN